MLIASLLTNLIGTALLCVLLGVCLYLYQRRGKAQTQHADSLPPDGKKTTHSGDPDGAVFDLPDPTEDNAAPTFALPPNVASSTEADLEDATDVSVPDEADGVAPEASRTTSWQSRRPKRTVEEAIEWIDEDSSDEIEVVSDELVEDSAERVQVGEPVDGEREAETSAEMDLPYADDEAAVTAEDVVEVELAADAEEEPAGEEVGDEVHIDDVNSDDVSTDDVHIDDAHTDDVTTDGTSDVPTATELFSSPSNDQPIENDELSPEQEIASESNAAEGDLASLLDDEPSPRDVVEDATADRESPVDFVLPVDATLDDIDASAAEADDETQPEDETPAAAIPDPPKAKLPPRRPLPPRGASSAAPTPHAPVESDAPAAPAETSSGLPPRKSALPPRKPTTPPPAAPTPAPSATGDGEEAEELRLALEASQNELSHLTAAREEALSAIDHQQRAFEETQARLERADRERQAAVEQRDALAAAQVQHEQHAATLQTENQSLRDKVAEQAKQIPQQPVEETLQAMEQQHLATVNELRTILAQREASEASLARERDGLLGQLDDARRKLTQQSEAGAADPARPAPELDAKVQQLTSELSLSRELVNQLNQNLSLRDARVLELQQGQESLKQQLATAAEATASAQQESADQQSLAHERDEFKSQLEATQRALQASSERSAQLEEQQAKETQAWEAKLAEQLRAEQSAKERLAALEQAHQQVVASQDSLSSENQTLAEARERALADLAVTAERADELEQTNQALAEARDAWSAERAQWASERENFQSTHAATSAEKEQLEKAVSELQQTVGQLMAQIPEDPAGTEQGDADVLQAQLQAAHEQLEQQRQRFEQAQQEATEKQAALASAGQQLEQELAEKVGQLQEQLKQQEQLTQQAARVEQVQQAAAEKEALLEQVRAESAGHREALERAEQVAAEQVAELGEVQRALSEQGERFAEAEAKLEQLQTEIADRAPAADEASSLSSELEAARQELEQREQELARLEEESTKGKEELRQAQEENQAYRKSVAELHAVANELEETRTKHQRQQDSSRERLQEAARANKELTEQLAAQKAESDSELQTLKKTLSNEKRALKRQLTSLEKEFKDLLEASSKKPRRRASGRAAEANGKLTASAAPKKTTRAKPTSRQRTDAPVEDAQRGLIFSRKPGHVDDLKQISGVGPALEKRLNAAGIYQFAQVKAWSKAVANHLDQELSLGGRITRDKWVAQARKLDKA